MWRTCHIWNPPKAANKVEDDSDGHESRHFKQACETQAAASLEFCLSD